MRLRPSRHPRSTAAAALLLAACGLNTYGLSDGSTATTTMSGGSTAPTGEPLPEAPSLQLSFSQIKQFDFAWSPAAGADYYQLLERTTVDDDYEQLKPDITETSISLPMPLHLRFGASYFLKACNAGGCTDSAPVDVVDSMADAVGYFKASNTEADDHFGARIALSSADGNTLVVGAAQEDSTASDAGAVYVFVRNGAAWSQEAYLKASNPGPGDQFGARVAISADGNTLAVGAYDKDGAADITDSGAVYVFVRMNGAWSQQAYLEASIIGEGDHFGESVALSENGDTLAIGAPLEDSDGINGDQANNAASDSGAAYVFVRDNAAWSQKAYLKAPVAGGGDHFGSSITLSPYVETLAVGAPLEDSNSTSVIDNSASDAGAVYVFKRADESWSEPIYLKASTPGSGDHFGITVALSADRNTLAIGANTESSHAAGIDGDQLDDSAQSAGAVFVFVWANMAWAQQAYIKASNPDAGDFFGNVALSADGDILAVGALGEKSTANGIGGDQTVNTAELVGSAYVFVRSGTAWSQRAYVKASNSGAGDIFGSTVAMSADGNTLAVGAYGEGSASIGIGGDQTDDSAPEAGAVYLY